jgi:hypothetical protein
VGVSFSHESTGRSIGDGCLRGNEVSQMILRGIAPEMSDETEF